MKCDTILKDVLSYNMRASVANIDLLSIIKLIIFIMYYMLKIMFVELTMLCLVI